MDMPPTKGKGTKDDPWLLRTPSGESEFIAYRDQAADPPAIVVNVGKTELRYHLRCLEDLHTMLVSHGDWMPLGNADEQKPVKEGTVEAWARSPDNPVGGWYGLKKGLRGRFATYIPPIMEVLRSGRGGTQPKEQPYAFFQVRRPLDVFDLERSRHGPNTRSMGK